MILVSPRHLILTALCKHGSFNLRILYDTAVKLKSKMFDKKFGVYIDICGNSVCDFLDRYESILDVDGDIVNKGESFSSFGEREFLDKTINKEFPPQMKDILFDTV